MLLISNALEMAARFKETNGGSVTVACVGPEQVKDSLKSCLAVGADKAYQITDSALTDLIHCQLVIC